MAPLKLRTLTSALSAATLLTACMGEFGLPSGPAGSNGAGDGTSEPPGENDGEPRPLRVTPQVVRRLTKLEYNNTVRDLLGTLRTPADAFPADGTAEGFDTVGSALSLSPLNVIAYEKAAHELVTELFEGTSEARARIVHCDVEQGSVEEGQTCARGIVGDFAKRAFRRPVTESELDSVLTPYRVASEVGATRLEGLKHSLAAVLISPYFLFKVELDDDPESTEPRRLNPYELATRLSYTLWSTLPDDALFAAAESGELTTDEGLSAQIDRMLDDPRSDALLRSFAGRWLEFDTLETHEVSADIFPEFSGDIARSMKGEAQAFMREFLHSDRPVKDMMTAEFTYVDKTLANHYGVPLEGGDDGSFVRIEGQTGNRSGLLTLGALLTLTSFSSRTSVVRRGEFVFSRMLCQHVPPPPPGVEGISMEDAEGLTLRERLERHRSDPACTGCHSLMDPLGFGLENYDAIGRFRTLEGTLPVDSSGVLPDGTNFDGAGELGQILSEDPAFEKCVTKKFATYAGGRMLHSGSSEHGKNDEAWIAHLTEQAKQNGSGSLRAVIRAVLTSEFFRSRVPAES